MIGRGKVIVILLAAAALAMMVGSAWPAGPGKDYPRIAPFGLAAGEGGPKAPRPYDRAQGEADKALGRRRQDARLLKRMFGPGPGGQFRPEQVERMERMMGLIKRMRHICFDPATAGMIGIGGLKDEVRRKQEAVVADLEGQLAKTKTLGLRNAIRMMLKDLYKARGEDEKVLGHLRGMVEENDAALSKEQGRRPAGWSPRRPAPARGD